MRLLTALVFATMFQQPIFTTNLPAQVRQPFTAAQIVNGKSQAESVDWISRQHFLNRNQERSNRTNGHLWDELVIETPDGSMQRLVSKDGRPLSGAQKITEDSASHTWKIIQTNFPGNLGSRFTGCIRHSRVYRGVTDIAETKRAEETLRNSERELRQILDLVPQQVSVYGPGGERLYANRIALDYYGVSLDEWRQTPGHTFRSSLFVRPDDQEQAARDFHANTAEAGRVDIDLTQT